MIGSSASVVHQADEDAVRGTVAACLAHAAVAGGSEKAQARLEVQLSEPEGGSDHSSEAVVAD